MSGFSALEGMGFVGSCVYNLLSPMKKSQKVTLTLLTAAAAAAISGCNRVAEAEVKRCVDDRNIMADERNCDVHPSPAGSTASGGGGGATGSSGDSSSNTGTSGYYGPRYRWVYGGNGGYMPGAIVYGAHAIPTEGLSTVRASELEARGYTAGGARVGIAEGGGFTAPPSSRGGFGASGHAFSGEGGGHAGE